MTNEPIEAKLMVTGISNHWRAEYRRLRRAGFSPNDATLVVYGGIRHGHNLAAAHERATEGDARPVTRKAS